MLPIGRKNLGFSEHTKRPKNRPPLSHILWLHHIIYLFILYAYDTCMKLILWSLVEEALRKIPISALVGFTISFQLRLLMSGFVSGTWNGYATLKITSINCVKLVQMNSILTLSYTHWFCSYINICRMTILHVRKLKIH